MSPVGPDRSARSIGEFACRSNSLTRSSTPSYPSASSTQQPHVPGCQRPVYDIEARIKNKKVEEQTLNKILQERSGNLEDVLKIEVELSRVRGEIERLEGKIRVLENLSSLATLTINVREREK